MKYLVLFFLLPFYFLSNAQQQFEVHFIKLPGIVKDSSNEISGMYISDGKLFLLSEGKVKNKNRPILYSFDTTNLNKAKRDSTYELPLPGKYYLSNLDEIKQIIQASGNSFEGLEALIIDSNIFYLSVETNYENSNNCFLLKGTLTDSIISLDSNFIIPLPRQPLASGKQVYNAGFEAILKNEKNIYCFFEYNYFPDSNFVYDINYSDSSVSNSPIKKIPFNKLPFRITDITNTGTNHFTAINHFYHGDSDSVYRPGLNDTENDTLVHYNSRYNYYTRLIDIWFDGEKFQWKPIWKFPPAITGFNWEGIAIYKGGYFIVNDMYTKTKEKYTQLIYLEPVE